MTPSNLTLFNGSIFTGNIPIVDILPVNATLYMQDTFDVKFRCSIPDDPLAQFLYWMKDGKQIYNSGQCYTILLLQSYRLHSLKQCLYVIFVKKRGIFFSFVVFGVFVYSRQMDKNVGYNSQASSLAPMGINLSILISRLVRLVSIQLVLVESCSR